MVLSVAKGYSTSKMLTLLFLAILLGLGSAFTLHWRYRSEESEQQGLETLPMLYTDKNTYRIGESIQIAVALINNEDIKAEIRWVEYDLTVHRLEEEKSGNLTFFCIVEPKIYTSKIRLEFPEPILVDPKSTYQVPIAQIWDQKSTASDQQVLAGTYLLKVQLLPYNLTATKTIVIEK